jgi:hypothetical protein
VKRVDGLDERPHGLLRVSTQLGDPLPEQLEMTELSHGHASEIRLVRQRSGQGRIVGEAEERYQGRISQQPKQVDDTVSRRLMLGHTGSVTMPPWRSADICLAMPHSMDRPGGCYTEQRAHLGMRLPRGALESAERGNAEDHSR